MYTESNLPLFIHTSLKKIMLMGEAANIALFVKKKKLNSLNLLEGSCIKVNQRQIYSV
jgi:hypothetical protein